MLRARSFWQACVLRYRRRQPAARQEPSVSRCRPPCGGCRTATARRQDPFTGEERVPPRQWTLPVRKARRCWLSGKELPRLPDAATSYGVCLQLLPHRTAARPFTPTCNTSIVRAGEVVQAGQLLGTAGADGPLPPGHTCILSCCRTGRPPATRRLCWACPCIGALRCGWGRCVFRDPLLLCGALYLLLWFDASGFLRIGLLAPPFLHEMGHILVYLCAVPRRFPVIEVTMTGFCMRTWRADPHPGADAFCSLPPGRAVNLACWPPSGQCGWNSARPSGAVPFLAANLLTGAFNLLPVPPLDGAQMLAALRCCVQSKSARNRVKTHFR